MLPAIKIKCPFCFQRQEVLVDPDSTEAQDLVVDCEVCCHPMDIRVTWDEDKQKFRAEVNKSSGF